MIDPDREEFEDFAYSHNLSTVRQGGEYVSASTHAAWLAWQIYTAREEVNDTGAQHEQT